MSLLYDFPAALLIAVITEWGPKRFSAIVSDNAANMVKARRLVLEKFPRMIENRQVLIATFVWLCICLQYKMQRLQTS